MASLSSLIKNTNKRSSDIIERLNNFTVKLTEEEEKCRSLCEKSLYHFVKTFWHAIEGDNEFHDNWHIRDICLHLQAASEGKLRYLIINIPFRCMKSLLSNVFFCSWQWISTPRSRFFCLTGDKELALRDSVKCRRLINCDLYKKFWGTNFRLNSDVNTNSRYSNNKGGERLIKSIGGNPIGHGGDFIIIDDVNRKDDIRYKKKRDRTNEDLKSSVFVRKNNAKKGVIIMIMQRLHEEDAANLILEMKLPGTVHLMLPMEFDPERACVTIPLTEGAEPWRDPRIKKDELLWPTYMDDGYVKELKTLLGSDYNISSQLQQLPAAESGNYFRKEWFNVWTEEKAPKCLFVMQSWDTAISTSVDACESAATTFGIFENHVGALNIILLNCWTGKLEQPDLRRMIIQSARNYHTKHPDQTNAGPKVDMVLIEDAFNGKGLIQDLRPSGIPVFPFSPRNHGLSGHAHETSKHARARLASILVEQGLLWLPAKDGQFLPFANRVYKALLACPTGKDQDIVDTCSQAFIEMRKRELVYLPQEQPIEPYKDWKNDPNFSKYMSRNLGYEDMVS